MKAVILALVVLLAVSHGEALVCNCGGLKHCPKLVETCFEPNSVCASVIIYAGSNINHFKSCMTMRNCMMMNRQGISSASCCMTDRCN